MPDDDLFRLILLAILAVFLPYAVYCRVRSDSGEKLDRWQEGPFILFGLRLAAVPGFLGGIAWLIHPQWMAWSSVPLPSWLRWLGVVLTACWGILVVWTFKHLGKNLTDTVVTRRDHTLTTTGPYRYVRHPFYLAFMTAVLGVSLATANWFLLVWGVIPFVFVVIRTRIEEQKLTERFGDAYRDYVAKTGKFLPRLRS